MSHPHCARLRAEHPCARLRTEPLENRILLAADSFQHDHADLDLSDTEFRTADGSQNNLVEQEQGAALSRVIRFGYPARYSDGHGDEIGVVDRPNARTISNEIHAQSETVLNDRHLTDWIFQWGQFLTHDMDLTSNGSVYNVLSTGEVGEFGIAINDPNDPLGPNPIPFNRSEFDPTTGTPDLIDTGFGPRANWREQINGVTSYIDASNVYGSDDARAAALRTFEGGKLITMADGLLPGLNDVGLANDDPFGLGEEMFLAGDIRANETAALTAVHALFVREHNRLADRIGELYPDLNDEEIYQLARRIVGAEMQAITYNEFLPALLGYDSAPKAADAVYGEDVNASITNSFATAIFRFGHSMINEDLLLVDNAGNTVGSVPLDDAFFDPDFLKDNPGNVDLLMKGLAEQLGQENDLLLIDGIRNNLFGPPGAGGLDLAALDIERGRDHGLPDYNSLRDFYGLELVTSFDQISSDPAIQAKLEELYGTIDNIDAFVGALAEDHLPGSSVGALVDAIIVNQFTRLRDGDRFFYTNDSLLSSRYVERIIDLDNVTLSKIIKQNTEITHIQDNVFFDPSVLFYRVPEGRRGSVTSVVATSEHVWVTNNRYGGLVEYGRMEDISQVIIVGSEARKDVVNVAVAGARNGIEDGVLVFGGGKFDVLNVMGSSQQDSIVVDAPRVSVNGTVVEFSDFEALVVLPGRGRDQVSVEDSGDTQVVVIEPRRTKNDRRGRDSESDHHHARRNAAMVDEPDKELRGSKRKSADDSAIVDMAFDELGAVDLA